jgi:hypothetical protein
VQTMTRRCRSLLASLLAVPGLDSGRPWRPDEVIPLPSRGAALNRARSRAGRQAMLTALERRGLVARTADGRYYLTPAAARLAPAGGAG